MSHQSGQQVFFLSADGIEPEVISAYIGLYVGRSAQVRVDRERGGYQISAQHRLTTDVIADMTADMREDSRRWQAERVGLQSGIRYSQSLTHRQRATWGPTHTANSRRDSSQQCSTYGSIQSQSAFGSLASRVNSSGSIGDYMASRQNTRSEMWDRDGRSDGGVAPSAASSYAGSYTSTGHASTQPIAIAGRQPRRDSNDSMYGFSRSPMSDDLRSPPFTARRDQQSSPYEYDRRYGR